MRIVVLAGGFSNERNVSLATGAMVAKSLRKKHKVAFVDMFLGVSDDVCFEDLVNQEISDKLVNVSDKIPSYSDIIASRKVDNNSILGNGVLRICSQADLVFLALHGANGEDGKIQATLDLLGIPYTGSDFLSSAIAMNKDLTKQLVKLAGVRTPDWKCLFVNDKSQIDDIINEFKLPVVIKVIDGGSSVGVYIVKNIDEFKDALMLNIGKKVVIEKYICGREIQMAFLRNSTLPSIEILSNSKFYDYSSKYQKGIANEITPADITKEQEIEMGSMLMKVVQTIGLYTYSRADFIIDSDGVIWFIEVNSLPGMTSTSLFPQEASSIGISFDELCEIIVQEGVRRKVGLSRYI